MRKLAAMILASCLCVSLTACGGGVSDNAGNDDQAKVFQVGDYAIWVTIPDDWEKSESDNFDLQCESPKKDMYLSTYGFSKMDLAEDEPVQSLFELQNEMILSIRDNVTEIEPISSTEKEDRIVYSALYSGEKEGSKNYYYFTFIQFKNTDDMVWVLYTGIPSVIEKNRENLDEILSKVQNSEPEGEV